MSEPVAAPPLTLVHPDAAPRGIALTPQQSQVTITEPDAVLLVLAIGVTVRDGGHQSPLGAGDEPRLRALARVLMQHLSPTAQATVRERAAPLAGARKSA
jgi:hypothetical protein